MTETIEDIEKRRDLLKEPLAAAPASTRAAKSKAKADAKGDIDIGALTLVEYLRRLERFGILDHDPEAIIQTMNQIMASDDIKDAIRLASRVVQWLGPLSKPISPNIAPAGQDQTLV
jgi:hypothetical protein